MSKRSSQRNRHLSRAQARAEIESERAFERVASPPPAASLHGNGHGEALPEMEAPQSAHEAITRVGEIMERAASSGASRQPRFSNKNASGIFSSVYRWVNSTNEPNANASVREWDKWLRDSVTEIGAEPHIAGVLNSIVQIDGNRGYTVTGGRNQVNRVLSVLQGANNGAGWRSYVKQQSQAFWLTRVGAVTELGRNGVGGPMNALYTVDPTLCELTDDPAKPLKFYASTGIQDWLAEDYFRFASMESTNEKRNGLGFPFVARALDLTHIMVAVWQHDKEQLGARAPRGLLLLKGISQDQWDNAMTARAENLDSLERQYYGGVAVLAGNGPDEISAQLMALSQLPAQFNLEQWVSLYMYGLALCAGYDPREFYPVSSGALGTSTETDAQHRKASSKGALDFPLEHQGRLQAELPATVLFEYDQRDAEGELGEVGLQKAKADLIDVMARWQSGGQSVLSANQIMQLAAQHNIIPQDWTPEEENVTGDDNAPEVDTTLAQERIARYVDRVERAIERERVANPTRPVNRVARTLERMADEPLVVYDSKVGRNVVLAPRVGDVLRRKSFPIARGEARTDESPQAPFPRTATVSRSIASVTDKFRRELRAIVSNYFTDKRKESTSALSNRIKEFVSAAISDAYFAGLQEGGIEPQDFDDDMSAQADDLIATQFEFVDGFVQAIVDARGDDDAQDAAIARAELWAASVNAAGMVGLATAKKRDIVTWRVGETEHCDTCAKLDGQKHTRKWFADRNYFPQTPGAAMDCGGFNCQCYFE